MWHLMAREPSGKWLAHVEGLAVVLIRVAGVMAPSKMKEQAGQEGDLHQQNRCEV
jgi:hypothetical protein